MAGARAASEGTRHGLRASEVVARLATDGPNVLPTPPPPSPLRHFLAQMTHFFALMLWIAGGLTFVANLPELGIAIFVVIVVNGVFAFVQEHRAERAATRLRDLMPRRAIVVRDGRRREVDAAELVVGDLVLLDGGDRISADLEAVETHGLMVNTSMLTGESAPVTVEPGGALFAGTFVVEGEAHAVVTATATRTRLAGIAALTEAGHRPVTPLARELSRVVRTIAIIAVGVGLGFFGLALLLGTDPRDGFLFAIGVTVALVPEGLLPTVTLSLAVGAQRMASRHALVRRLEAVETLGSTTYICTDKTGTLTRNEMTVVEVWMPEGAARVHGSGYGPDALVDVDDHARSRLVDIAVAAVRCSTGRVIEHEGTWTPQGDPMEAALDTLAHRVGADVERAAREDPERRRFAFDPRRRRMAVVTGRSVLVKGAPDAVLPRCRDSHGADDALDALASRGLRVLAIAARSVPPSAPPPASAGDAERDLALLGLVALEDPPRETVTTAIAACRHAGIRLAMITGDHPATARAIADEVGLLGPGGVVVVGDDLPDDDAALGALLDQDGVVVSRVSPEQKLRIARALRARGHVVAMTGDGVNDGPALQEADIGIAMGQSGTDVAREAADLVLLDDNFATIVAAVEQGRATYANIRRFLTYHLTDNVAELTPFVVWALSAGTFPLALGVLQVLALDIGTDLLPALALGAEPPGEHVLEQEPQRGRLLDRAVLRRVFLVLGPTEAVVEMTAFVVTFLAAGWRPGEDFPGGATLLAASGAAFSAVVIGQAANAFACRSTTRWPGRLGWTSNRLLIGAVVAALAALAAFLYVPALADLLDQAPPTLAGFAVALLAAPAVLAVDALDKARRARRPEAGPT
jgi:magnesium-transporting ATPase (P-type)